MLTIGLDVHQSHTSVCVMDARGNILKQQEVRGGHAAVAETLRKLNHPFQACYEASSGYGALYDQIAPLARRVQVAHPGRLKLIFNTRKKHNRADAKKLATLMHLNQVPQVHVPSQQVRSWRGIIEHRRSLVDQSVGIKSQVRALLRNCGIQGRTGKTQWSAPGIQWLKELTWPTELEALRLQVMLEQLEGLKKKIKRVTEALDQIADKHPGVTLLMTIPCVGPRTAEAFVAYVDDPHRFTSGTIGAYFGLVPREDSTGDHRRLGHITHEGPATVRKFLTEAGWRGISKSARLKEVYQRFLHGDKKRRKLAMVAMGHWLCRVMLAMLKSGEMFRETTTPACREMMN